MCTAISFTTADHYFGRNLDLEYSYRETVTITPRRFPFPFRKLEPMQQHYAMIGMAYVVNNYPLYYDATNEMGLSMAGLSFEGNAFYYTEVSDKKNVTPFELIPFILGQCKCIQEVEQMIKCLNVLDEAFSEELSLSSLHWIVSDKKESIVIETMADGMRVHKNPTGVLTNNPPFEYQIMYLNNYMTLSGDVPQALLSNKLSFDVYSRGLGALGLPGDLSSSSRFVRSVFVKENSICGKTEAESVSQFFHILGAVEQQRGCVRLGNDKYEITVYSSCCNTDKGIYYYKTYDNSQIMAVKLHEEKLEGKMLVQYPLMKEQQIRYQNGNRWERES